MENASIIFSKVLEREIKYQKMPMILTRVLMGKNLAKMFHWLNANYAILLKDSTVRNKEYPNMLDLGQWIKLNFKKSNLASIKD